jgi:hypothetical protein
MQMPIGGIIHAGWKACQGKPGLGARGSKWNENMARIAACMVTATPQITNPVE